MDVERFLLGGDLLHLVGIGQALHQVHHRLVAGAQQGLVPVELLSGCRA